MKKREEERSVSVRNEDASKRKEETRTHSSPFSIAARCLAMLLFKASKKERVMSQYVF